MTDILKFDYFAPDAPGVRRAVVDGGFSTVQWVDGATYTGISQHQVPHWHDRIAELIGETVIPRVSFFRINFKGELPHKWVHSDTIGGEYAGVLYLNLPEQCQGGTAFWKHKRLGMDRLLPKEELAAMGIDPEGFYDMMPHEWGKKEMWEQVAFVPMKWNRFVTYPSALFHSRFPHEAFGDTSEDGRLYWACFYDKANVQ